MTEREEGRCVLRGHQRSVALLRLLRLLLPLPTAAAGCAEETIAEETPYRFHYKIRWRRLIILYAAAQASLLMLTVAFSSAGLYFTLTSEFLLLI